MNIRPLPGHAVCEIESQFKDKEGLIVIPRTGQRLKGKIGRVVTVTLWCQAPAFIWRKGKKELVQKPWILNADYEGIEDSRVAFEQYAEMQHSGKTWAVVRLEHMVAVVDDEADAKIEGITGEVPRCPRCRSRGELNIMLDGKGYCPECGKNPAGDVRDGKKDKYGIPLSDRVSDEEKEAFDPASKKLKGTITSYR
jgi:hypothetical protein